MSEFECRPDCPDWAHCSEIERVVELERDLSSNNDNVRKIAEATLDTFGSAVCIRGPERQDANSVVTLEPETSYICRNPQALTLLFGSMAVEHIKMQAIADDKLVTMPAPQQ